jgi:hypothetical protein
VSDAPKPALNLVVLHETNFRQPAATLRVIADEIEAGQYGAVGEVAIALLGTRLEVFCAGPNADATSAACLLQAGANKLIAAIVGHGADDN